MRDRQISWEDPVGQEMLQPTGLLVLSALCSEESQ